MKHPKSFIALNIALAFTLAACSSEPTATSEGEATAAATVAPAPDASAAPTQAAAQPGVIGLEGLGDLRLGQPVPKGSTWAERGAQIEGSCKTVSSPDYPGVYGMVIGDKVRRITVGQRSSVKLVEGIGVGSTEVDVRKWFASFRAEPHKYEDAPAKYLTAPNAESGDPAVRFEIGRDGKVSFIHVGMMPELAYVEGCA